MVEFKFHHKDLCLTCNYYNIFTIDEDIKKQFNIACATLDINMSETVQAMMQNFIDVSKSMEEMERDRLLNLKGDAQVHEVEIVEPSGRLKLDDNG